jgi:hypothetical protein
MNVGVFRTLVVADSRVLWRDPLLGWILALPLGLALLLRVLIPRMQEARLAEAGFDLMPYYPLVMGGYRRLKSHDGASEKALEQRALPGTGGEHAGAWKRDVPERRGRRAVVARGSRSRTSCTTSR